MASLIVHQHRLTVGPSPALGRERSAALLRPQSVAQAMGSTAMRSAAALELQGEQAAAEWQKIAGYLYHLGHDPNWRHVPPFWIRCVAGGLLQAELNTPKPLPRRGCVLTDHE